MADYVQKLRDDLVEQFKGKPVIDALMEAVGDELNEVRQFYEASGKGGVRIWKSSVATFGM